MPPPAATRRRRARKARAFHVSELHCMPPVPDPVVPWERDWAELPADAISCVLHKLDIVELLLGDVRAVCRFWRRAVRGEPELWRRIDVRYLPYIAPFTRKATRYNIMRAALRLGARQCHSFAGEDLDDDHFLLLAQHAHSLKRLQLTRCSISDGVFVNAVRKFPLLEELQLVHCFNVEVVGLVARACGRLKHFTLVQEMCHSYHSKSDDDDLNAFAITRMHGLRSLILVCDELSNEGLTAIIDNCPHLEYLKMCDCRGINMDCNLAAKCARIIDMDYYQYFPPYGPCRCCMSPISWGTYDYNDYRDYDYDDHHDLSLHDLSLYYYLGDYIDDDDFEEHERILDIKHMRRYLS